MPPPYPTGYINSPPTYLHQIPRGLRGAAGPLASARDDSSSSGGTDCPSSSSSSSADDDSSDDSSSSDQEVHPPLVISEKSRSKKSNKRKGKAVRSARKRGKSSATKRHHSNDTEAPIVVAWGSGRVVIPAIAAPRVQDTKDPSKKNETTERDIEVLTTAGSISQYSTSVVTEDEWETRETCTTWIKFKTWVAFPKDLALSVEEVRVLQESGGGKRKGGGKGKEKQKQKQSKAKGGRRGKKGKRAGQSDGKTTTEDESEKPAEEQEGGSPQPKISNLVPLPNTPAAERLEKLLNDVRSAKAKGVLLKPRPWSERNGFVSVEEAEGGMEHDGDEEREEAETKQERTGMTANELHEQFKREMVAMLEGPEEGSDGWGREGVGWVTEEVVPKQKGRKGKDEGAGGRVLNPPTEDEAGGADDEESGDSGSDSGKNGSSGSDSESEDSSCPCSSCSSERARKRPVKKTGRTKEGGCRDAKIEGLELLLKGMLMQLGKLKGGG